MRAYQLFADILDYPRPDLAVQVRECVAQLPPAGAESAASLKTFQAFVEETGRGQLEELYTSTFDMQADCSLYIGYQVFGDDRRRGIFMAKLREDYRTHGFSDGGELPDHLAVILRYLAVREPDELTTELTAECVLPAVAKIVHTLEARRHAYAPVFQAIWALLKNDNRGQESVKQAEALQQR